MRIFVAGLFVIALAVAVWLAILSPAWSAESAQVHFPLYCGDGLCVLREDDVDALQNYIRALEARCRGRGV